MNSLPVLTLKRRESTLADPAQQLRILNSDDSLPSFASTLEHHGLPVLVADRIEILQVNLGKLCNMTCRHCHVDAGPDRKEENMDRQTVEACLDAIRLAGIGTIDLTGGAPEMNPHFRHFVEQAKSLGCQVIDRCNLTILLANGFEDLPEFLAQHQVEVVASLPCYLQENADAQRGDGAFQKSIAALKRLNQLGYGESNSELRLTLVYNPIGPSLPPNQVALEQQYRDHLQSDYGIEFTNLITITNMPISRFLEELIESGKYADYMHTLVNSFNPHAVAGVMCRRILSVGWDGRLFDCDFNQMLDVPTNESCPRNIRDFDWQSLAQRSIQTSRHCFGCTAGSGSGCLGAIDT